MAHHSVKFIEELFDGLIIPGSTRLESAHGTDDCEVSPRNRRRRPSVPVNRMVTELSVVVMEESIDQIMMKLEEYSEVKDSEVEDSCYEILGERPHFRGRSYRGSEDDRVPSGHMELEISLAFCLPERK